MILKPLIQTPEQDVLLTESYFRAAVALHKFIPSLLIRVSFKEIGKIKQQALFRSPCHEVSYVQNCWAVAHHGFGQLYYEHVTKKGLCFFLLVCGILTKKTQLEP